MPRQDALAEAREAVSLNPDIAVAVLALGETLLAVEALPTAIAELQRALRLDPGLDTGARADCASLAGGREKPTRRWRICSELDDAPPAALVAAAQRRSRPAPRSDPGYVRHLFDQFSADYDSRMLGPALAYAAPQILARPGGYGDAGASRTLDDPGPGLRYRLGRGRLQTPGGAAGRRGPVAGHDRKSAGATDLRFRLLVADLETALGTAGSLLTT